jgi:hypothetical protein
MVKKCVDQGHWACHEVCCAPSLCERIHEACKKHREGCCYCPPPPKTKMEKCWVPCKVWIECPVTRMERTCEYKPVTCKVTCYKQEVREEKVQVTCCKCVPEQRTETYCCYTQKLVPFQATRVCQVCVPYQETVTCCRMVCRTVEKKVPVCESCCQPCCCQPCCKSHHKFCGHFGHKSSCCCE